MVLNQISTRLQDRWWLCRIGVASKVPAGTEANFSDIYYIFKNTSLQGNIVIGDGNHGAWEQE